MADLRWDQGRRDYFALNALKGFCEAVAFVQTTRQPDLRSFKDALTAHLRSGPGIVVGGHRLQFLPTSYGAWRNYGRIYRSIYLVYEASAQLELTPLGSLLTTLDPANSTDQEQFYSALASRLRWPNPAFDEYVANVNPVYMVQTAIKLLAFKDGGPIAVEQLARFLWACGNPSGGLPISGTESLGRIGAAFDGYSGSPAIPKDRMRQFREMLSFFAGSAFEITSEGIMLAPARLSDIGDTLVRYCNPAAYRPSPNPDRDVEIRLRGSLVPTSAPTARAAEPPTVIVTTRAVAQPSNGGGRTAARRQTSGRAAPRVSYYTLSNERQIQAERLVHEHLVGKCGPASVVWFAKTPIEFAPHDGLDAPGADGQVLAGVAGVPAGYHEVKSREGAGSLFSLTRNEIRRLLDCARRSVGYHLWEVTFDASGRPTLKLIPDLQNEFAVGSPRYEAALFLFETDARARLCQFQL